LSLAPGTRLGAYEVTARIGEGGMGEVWRATDPNLGREVAIKVLPDGFAQDPDRLARLEREARTLASLNHPNVATIYGLEKSDGAALVMELIDGVTLAERIAQGPLPLGEALRIAKQIIEALEAAHEVGIVHRDLKPSNVKVRADGTVKVLDFGLAKSVAPGGALAPGLAASATVTAAGTLPGTILGTVAYMSPEQASGRPVDARTDIWAFGVLLFELLAGRRPFEGAPAEVLGAILASEPKWDALPATVPTRIRQVIRACLQKDVRQRLANAQDVRLALDGVFDADVIVAPKSPLSRSLLAMAVVGIAALAAVLWTGLLRRPSEIAAGPVVRSSHVLPPGLDFSFSSQVLAISPDGRRYAYYTTRGLYVRSMDAEDGQFVPGTEEAIANPFFSADGQSVAYFQAGRLKRQALAGGAPVVIASAGNPFGATWAADGSIFFAELEGIKRVPASGGTPELLVPAASGEQLNVHQLLPDGETLLFSTSRPVPFIRANRWDSADIVVQSLHSGARRVLMPKGSDPRYVPSGHVLYAVEDVLYAVRFDVQALEARGGPVSVLSGVSRGVTTGAANYAVSDDGTLFYAVGAGAVTRSALTWVDREGRTEPIPEIRPGFHRTPRLSPDDTRVLVETGRDLRTYDLATGRETRLTSDGQSGFPAWRQDGTVAYTSSRSEPEATSNVWLQPPDAGARAARLTTLTGQVDVDSWSPDGRTLAVHHHPVDGGIDLLMISIKDGKASDPVPFAADPHNETASAFSPDGRYVAYQSNETGRNEVYIRPFPGPGGRTPVSTGGGAEVVWARNGELFFRRVSDHMMMAVPVRTTPTLTIGQPRPLFRLAGLQYGVSAPRYAVTADGKRLLMNAVDLRVDQGGTAPRPAINIVQNWHEELKRLVP
jgi:serine/threonine protein kinase/Tol biopolymer transport system component